MTTAIRVATVNTVTTGVSELWFSSSSSDSTASAKTAGEAKAPQPSGRPWTVRRGGGCQAPAAISRVASGQSELFQAMAL